MWYQEAVIAVALALPRSLPIAPLIWSELMARRPVNIWNDNICDLTFVPRSAVPAEFSYHGLLVLLSNQEQHLRRAIDDWIVSQLSCGSIFNLNLINIFV